MDKDKQELPTPVPVSRYFARGAGMGFNGVEIVADKDGDLVYYGDYEALERLYLAMRDVWEQRSAGVSAMASRIDVIEECAKLLDGIAGQEFVREMFVEANTTRSCAAAIRHLMQSTSDSWVNR